MMNCRLCNGVIDDQGAIKLDVPAGTQLFSEDAGTAEALKTRISIHECPRCSLIQLAGDPVAYEHVSSSSSFVSTQLTEHRLLQLRRLLMMTGAPEGSGRLLEIGCGDGHLLEDARRLFEHSTGVEPTRRNASAAAQRGLEVHQMLMAHDAVVPGGPFNYFCTFHVLEHVTDICSVLQGIAAALTADAVGIVEVPSTEAALENERFGDFMPDHLNYFTESTLRLALEWNGFTVESIERNWGNEHLVGYVRRRSSRSKLTYIAAREAKLDELVAVVNGRNLTFAIWGISHHVLPYIPFLTGIEGLVAVDGSSSKIGKYIPSTQIQVKPVATLSEFRHLLVAVPAPRFRDEILSELSRMFDSVIEDAQLSELLGFGVFECRAVPVQSREALAS